MTFLNPLVLFGLAAASIPVLLHLLNLRKLKIIEFSTLAFLKELQKTKIRKLKLKQILLLILRTLLIIFIVFAFARPTLQQSFGSFGAHAKTSVVIVVDNSFSMDISDERGVRLKQAKDAAQSIIGALQDGDEVSLILMANLDDKRFFEFTRNFSLLKEEVNKIPISYTVAKLESGLRLASTILSQSKNINKEVYVITDAQKNIIDEEVKDSLKLFTPSVMLYAVPIGLGSVAGERNLSVDSLNVLTRIFETEKPVEVEGRIRNSGRDDAKGVIVSLKFNGDRVAQRAVDIPAGETRVLSLSANPHNRGIVRAEIEVEGDALEADNHRYFGFVIPDAPKIALVGSNSDTKFLNLALLPENQNSGALVLLATEQLSGVNLAEFSTIFLVNIPQFSQTESSRLQNYVQNGGSIFVFAGENSDLTSYNQTILPALGFGSATAHEYTHDKPSEFSMVDKAHPLFSGVFKGNAVGKATVESPKIYHSATVVAGQPIIQLTDGAFLAESKLGSGRAMFCAVPPTQNWSTFPMTGIFVSIANRAVAYLSASESFGDDISVGQTINLSLPKKFASGGNFKILDPNGVESFRQAAVLPGGAVLSLESLHQPGVYVLETNEGKIVKTLAVNPPASESIITQFTNDELKQTLARRAPDSRQAEVIDNARNLSTMVARVRVGTELWKLFVVLAILCALAEMFVARNSQKEAEK